MTVYIVALPTEGVDRNILVTASPIEAMASPSPRRAWIEICCFGLLWRSSAVALPTEGVDRNLGVEVAVAQQDPVALPTEGVDRNNIQRLGLWLTYKSPSPRRAWIEILVISWLTFSPDCRPPHGGRG